MQQLWRLVLGLRAWLIGFVVYAIGYGVLFGDESASGVAGTGALLGFFLGSVALAGRRGRCGSCSRSTAHA